MQRRARLATRWWSSGLKGLSASALVQSLEARASATLEAEELADLVQTFGDDYRLIVGSSVPASGRPQEALAQVAVRVWHNKSPDRGERDVEVTATLAQLYLGGNLETAGAVQEWLFGALQRANRRDRG